MCYKNSTTLEHLKQDLLGAIRKSQKHQPVGFFVTVGAGVISSIMDLCRKQFCLKKYQFRGP